MKNSVKNKGWLVILFIMGIVIFLAMAWGSGSSSYSSSGNGNASSTHSESSIKAPKSSYALQEMDVEEAVQLFLASGFENIKIKGNGKLINGFLHSSGDVESVSVGGNSSFSDKDYFDKSSLVIIKYYSYNEEQSVVAGEAVLSPSETEAQTSADKQDESTVPNKEETSKVTTTAPTQKTIGLNQTVTVGKLEFTVLKVQDVKKIGSEYFNETTENNFAIVTIQIKNNGTSERYLTDSNFLYYRDGSKYESHTAGLYLDNNGFWLNVTIGANLSKTINVVYEIPSTHLETDYILVKDSLLTTQKIYLKPNR